MGFLEKAFAYRWATRGNGGGDEGMNPLALVMIALVGVMLLVIAIEAALSFLYETIRSLLLLVPNLGAIVLAVFLAGIAITLVSPATPARASEFLSDKGSNFVTKSVVATVALTAFGLGMDANVIPEPGESGGVPIISFALLAVFFYYVYCIYLANKLAGAAPNGPRYRVAMLFPISFMIVAEGFALPVSPILAVYELSEILSLLTVYSPLLIGLAIVKYRVEPALAESEPATERSAEQQNGIGPGQPDEN